MKDSGIPAAIICWPNGFKGEPEILPPITDTAEEADEIEYKFRASKLVTTFEASQAVSISERQLQRLARQGRVPFYKLSPRVLRWDIQELKDYMKLIALGQELSEQGP